MASTFSLEIATPERKFFSDEAEIIIVTTPQGEMAVLRGHEPMVVAIAAGPIRIKKGNEWLDAVLTEGFMEVTPEKAIILADTAEWPNEVDANRAKAAKERAEERLQRQLSKVESIRTQAALARAMARLKVTREIR